jgi:hypothetical protein
MSNHYNSEDEMKNYNFYSIYGWRVSPPANYPHKSFNTPYNVKMEDCKNKCGNSKNKIFCLEKCSQEARMYSFNKMEKSKLQTRESFSYPKTSFPSHDHAAFRSHN